MKRIAIMIKRLAYHDSNVLIHGESGVGKERVAKLLHNTRFPKNAHKHPFIAINCGAIAENLIESELFGHEKGAFTGADRQHKGVFERAFNGTLFLDEIGEMPLAMQVKLLRVLQERILYRVGGETPIEIHVNLVSATHQDLEQHIMEGLFREDLYYRLAVFNIQIPPLRERIEDILPLAEQFLSEFTPPKGGGAYVLSQQAKTALLTYAWPGNIRQLKNILQRAVIMSDGRTINADALNLNIQSNEQLASDKHLSDYIALCERGYIVSTLEQFHWKIVETAQSLGISRKNLWEKMRKLNIQHNSST